MDWSILELRIAGEPLTKDGLRKRRDVLEKMVAPYVTTRKTADTILFKGKRQYAKPLNTCRNDIEIAWNIYALQSLYEIEAAWKAGDIDKAIGAAVSFGRCDDEAWKCKLSKSDSWNALATQMRRRIVGRRAADKTNSCRAAKRPDFKTLVAQAMRIRPSYQAAVEQVANNTDYSERTVRKHAPNPAPQNRGRWKTGRKNAKRLS